MTPQSISKLNWEAYNNTGFLTRWLSRLRPYICPFQELLVHVPEKASHFDIGCGSGVFLYLASTYRQISKGVGTDVNPAALETAKRAVGSDQLSFFLSKEGHEWPDETFDAVSLIDVLHHVSPVDQKVFLRQAAARVKKGGKIIYKDMAKKPLFYAFMNRLHDLVLARQWIHYFDLQDVRDVLIDAGFKISYERVTTCYWYRHELIVAEKL